MRVSVAISVLRIALITWFVLMQAVHLDVGLADNGDFTRIMTWFTSRPIGFEGNWPASGTEEWNRRFVRSFLPYWHLDYPGGSDVYSSVLVLWAPGVALNHAFFSPNVLSLPIVSLVPRLALAFCLLGLFRWIDTAHVGTRKRLVLYLTTALPLVAIATTTDYVAFFNSFYQETATLVFVFTFLVALLFHRRNRSRISTVAVMGTLFLLASAKASHAYLPLLALFLIAPRPFPGLRHLGRFAAYAVVVVILVAASFGLTRGANDPAITKFHGLFFGVLTLSDHPDSHLDRMGRSDMAGCIGISAFTAVAAGQTCVERTKGVSRLETANVILHEPMIAPRMLRYVAGEMQVAGAPYVGLFAADDPRCQRSISPCGDDRPVTGVRPIMNWWSLVKQDIFPKGDALLIVVALYAVLFLARLRWPGDLPEVPAVGLFASVGVLTEMVVVFLGDGGQELRKHLFLANLLFDVATTLAIATVALAAPGLLAQARSRGFQLYLHTGRFLPRSWTISRR